ncbi:YqzL family protein [Paenibacillus thermotolerans]|uniref:YqzL family protein n=1 Tax=Paenibacillus thermotolerans TaxID=3027807 RepID=UPI002367EB8F|nr:MULTISPECIES: YqzL family protein [unclassified Paenibacillus]
MRDFSWKYFTLTGDVDAYMLFKEWDQMQSSTDVHPDEIPGDEDAEVCSIE